MKKLYFILIALVTVSMANAQFGGGDGTSEGTAYEISNFAELKYLADTEAEWVAGKYFKLTDNIDAAGQNINSIGLSDLTTGSAVTKVFKGFFDGNGKTISNLNVVWRTNQNDKYMGLFGAIEGATIQKLALDHVVVANETVFSTERAGVLVGTTVGGTASTISECSVTNSTVHGQYTTGAICGRPYDTNISDCYVANVNIPINHGVTSGGICGKLENGTSVNTSFSYGRIAVGKLAGTATISNVFTDQDATATSVGSKIEAANLGNLGSYTGFEVTGKWEIMDGMARLSIFKDIALPVSKVTIERSEIKVIGKTLYVNDVNATNYKVYNLSGMLVTEGALVSSTVDLALPQGIYIIKVGAEAKKVMLK